MQTFSFRRILIQTLFLLVLFGAAFFQPASAATSCYTYENQWRDCADVAGSYGIPVYHTEGEIEFSQTRCTTDGVTTWYPPEQTGGGCYAPPPEPQPCSKTNYCGTHTTYGEAIDGVCDAPEPYYDDSCIEVCTTHGPVTESCGAAMDRLAARDGVQSSYFGYPATYRDGTVTYTQQSCTQYNTTTWYWPNISSGSCYINGACGGSVNSCSKGTFSDTSDVQGEYRWNCLGVAGGSNASCSSAYAVNGSCGGSHNSCASGSFSDVADDSTYYLWNCNGLNGGGGASCYLEKPVNGSCGSTNNACTSGSLSDTADSSTHYLWNCNGAYGGTNASCSLEKPLPPGAPTGLDGTPGSCGTGRIDLSWNASSGATTYALQRSLNSSFTSPTVVYSGGNTSYSNTGLAAGTTYYYRVRASNAGGNSAWSSTLTVTAPSACVSGNISANPTTVVAGQTSTISWTTSNASSCTVTSLPANGDSWSGTSDAGQQTSALTTNTTYVLSCSPTFNDSVAVTVLSTPTLVAIPRVVETGTNVTLDYNTNGQTCTLSGGGETFPGLTGIGSRVINNVPSNTTYTLDCPIGDDATVTVEIAQGGFET